MNNCKLILCIILITSSNKKLKTNSSQQINPSTHNGIENKTHNSHAQNKSKNANKIMHIVNGNIKTTILQVNSSNTDWITKLNELLSTIHNNKANITIVSEANVEHKDTDKTITRNSTFKDYLITL